MLSSTVICHLVPSFWRFELYTVKNFLRLSQLYMSSAKFYFRGRRIRSFIKSRNSDCLLIMQNFTFQVKLLMMMRKLNPLLPRISRLMLQPMMNPKQKREKMNSRLVTPQPDFKKMCWYESLNAKYVCY